MNNEVVQSLIVLLIVGWSLTVTLRRFVPPTMQHRLAGWLQVKGWLKLGGLLAPAASSGGCGGGCNSCQTGCTPVAAEVEQVVQWRK